MDANTTDALAATALAGLVWEVGKAYRSACPDIPILRESDSNDPKVLQLLVDADFSVGIPALVAGGIASWLMRSWAPVVIVAVALAALSWYHHSILHDPTT